MRDDKGNSIACNADMRIAEVRKFCKLDETSESLMRAAMSQLNLSARACHRILKLARTIADLAGSEQIQTPHLAEALQYKPKLMVGLDYFRRKVNSGGFIRLLRKSPLAWDFTFFKPNLCNL